jgi:hypothetical protein
MIVNIHFKIKGVNGSLKTKLNNLFFYGKKV